ncbi:MAG: site-specific integrase, partial [Pseudomonadota bacterium]
QWRNTLASHAFPVFGDLSVAEIDTGLVLKALEPVWTVRPETASRLRGRIENVLAWASARGLRSGENPARWRGHLDTLLPARAKVAKVTHHKAVPWRALPALMERIATAKGVGARALHFTILTAARSGEVREMRWGEVDLQAGLWVVPAQRMKAGREHRVPLSDAALAVLAAVRPLQMRSGGRAPVAEALVFPGSRGKALSDMTLTAVFKRLGVEATVHGTARSSFKDWCAEATGYPNEVSEMALAHTVSSAVERAYRRGDMVERRRRLMADWARFLSGEIISQEVIAIHG